MGIQSSIVTLVLQSIIVYPIPATSHPNRDNMAKVTIHCVRHAQGFHNLSLANHTIPDPLLTPHGKSQCQTLSSTFPSPSKITHLVSSPLRRTLYTTLLSFPTAITRGIRITALSELQETSNLPCEFSQGEFAGTVDLSHVS